MRPGFPFFCQIGESGNRGGFRTIERRDKMPYIIMYPIRWTRQAKGIA